MTEHPVTQTTSKRKAEWWVYTVPVLLVLYVLFHVILMSGPGKLRLLVYYLGPVLISFLAVVFLLVGIIQSIIRRPFISKWRVIGFAGLILFPLCFLLRADQQGTFFNAYPSSHAHEKSNVVFRLPLDTPITVAWGGDKVATNYHVTTPDQRWAYDLLVTRDGKTYVGDSTKHESFLCYGLPVLAPAAGEVVSAFDSVRDRPVGDVSEVIHVGGNQIILKVAQGKYLVLCHLKPGSVLVKKGDKVAQGQQLASVGNSGHTSEPHLHIQLQDSDDDFFAEGIPLYFSNYIANGKTTAMGMPLGGIDKLGNFTGEIVRQLK